MEETFLSVYTKFKLHFYKEVFSRFETREASLTAVETFCAEIIHALDMPTITEFAEFANISAQNATHRVNNLVRKGYVERVRSADDRREFKLIVTGKFFEYYDITSSYVREIVSKINERFTPQEAEAFERYLNTIDKEIMDDV